MVQGDYQSDLSNDVPYMSVDQSVTPFTAPMNPGGGIPQQWPQDSQGLNIPFSSEQVMAPMTGASNMNTPLSGHQALKTETKVPVSQGGPEFVQLGGDNKLLSLSNILTENIDMGMSLPSLPSIGEEFPNNMQMGMAVVAAEETVQSSDSPTTTAPEAQPQQTPNTSAASLNRRIGESTDMLKSLQNN